MSKNAEKYGNRSWYDIPSLQTPLYANILHIAAG